MKKIKLTQDKFAIVDNLDFEWLNQLKWCYDKSTGYAVRQEWLKDKKKYRKVYMHRLILNPENLKLTDHINRERLDNRRSNLRPVNIYQSNINTDGKPPKSGYRGVLETPAGKWVAIIWIKRKEIRLGTFKRKEEAILARRWGEKLYYKGWHT